MRELPRYDGPLEGVLHPTPDEILRELMGVIEAAQEKSIRLTKSGIPPKPLWGAINERLLWQDSKSILYDWDEVDQVRFVYALAAQLALVQPDDERLLTVGPGADEFFLASPTRRSEMLTRGYLEVIDWDERCDARNELGHRHNFGQTFRRDFLLDPYGLRRALLDVLRQCPNGGWVQASDVALALTIAQPDMLISEDDDVPVNAEGESDPEIERIVEYWVIFAARFGWVDLARTPVDFEDRGQRLLRLTPLGEIVTGKSPAAYEAEEKAFATSRPFVIQPNNDIVFYRDSGDIGDEYLLRRISVDHAYPRWDIAVATYHVTLESLRRAFESGLDPNLVESRLVARSRTDAPPTFRSIVKDAQRQLGRMALTQGLSAVEIVGASDETRAAIVAAGFRIFDDLAVVPWRRWSEFAALLDDDLTEGFRYPPEEPLGHFEGATLELEWPVLPMIARDLLVAVGVSGDPPSATFDETTVGALGRQGWTPKAVAEAIAPLCDGELPPWLASELG